MEIKGKFNKGDIVYSAESSYVNKIISCPDCLGTLKWIIVFADGEAKEIECQTCKRGWESASGKITYQEWSPTVSKVTIGSIKYDGDSKQPFSYMCVETGIGSGRVYYEEDLFDNFEEAMKFAVEKNQEQVKAIANNNFGPKFSKRNTVEDMLSTFGFTRKQAIEEARKFRMWANLSGIIKK